MTGGGHARQAGTPGAGDGTAQWNGAAPVPTRVMLRPLASPVPLGFLGLGAGTLILAAQQVGWVPATQSHAVAIAVLLTAVPLQLTASAVGFACRDPAVATGMGTLGGTWACIGVLTLLGPPGGRSVVLGFMLFYLAAAVLVSALVAATGKGIAALVLGLAAARFAVTGVYEYTGASAWMTVAGWLGLALGALALYAAAALELEAVRHRTTLPTLRYGPARSALGGADGDTAGAVQREAGVREQL